MEEAILALLKEGLLGVLLIVMASAFWYKDQRVRELNETIAQVIKEEADKKLELAERVFQLVSVLSNLVDDNDKT